MRAARWTTQSLRLRSVVTRTYQLPAPFELNPTLLRPPLPSQCPTESTEGIYIYLYSFSLHKSSLWKRCDLQNAGLNVNLPYRSSSVQAQIASEADMPWRVQHRNHCHHHKRHRRDDQDNCDGHGHDHDISRAFCAPVLDPWQHVCLGNTVWITWTATKLSKICVLAQQNHVYCAEIITWLGCVCKLSRSIKNNAHNCYSSGRGPRPSNLLLFKWHVTTTDE